MIIRSHLRKLKEGTVRHNRAVPFLKPNLNKFKLMQCLVYWSGRFQAALDQHETLNPHPPCGTRPQQFPVKSSRRHLDPTDRQMRVKRLLFPVQSHPDASLFHLPRQMLNLLRPLRQSHPEHPRIALRRKNAAGSQR